jgi:hypothetical protein
MSRAPPAFRAARIRAFLEFAQRGGPEVVEVRAQRDEGVWAQLVQAPSGDRGGGDESSVLEDPEMLGDRGAAHRELPRDFGHGEWTIAEQLEDGAAGGITERIELAVWVSTHLR